MRASSALLLGFLACAAALPVRAADSGVEPVDTDYDRQPVNTVVPQYPPKARRARIEGEVQVCFDISREGFPRRIAVRRSARDQGLPDVSLRARSGVAGVTRFSIRRAASPSVVPKLINPSS